MSILKAFYWEPGLAFHGQSHLMGRRGPVYPHLRHSGSVPLFPCLLALRKHYRSCAYWAFCPEQVAPPCPCPPHSLVVMSEALLSIHHCHLLTQLGGPGWSRTAALPRHLLCARRA